MRRFLLPSLVFMLANLGACSLINAPPDVNPSGSGGGSGGTGPATTSTTGSGGTTATTSTTGPGGGGGTGGSVGCTGDGDCLAMADLCNIGRCVNTVCTKLVDSNKEGLPCDDGLFCVENEICTAGVCTGTPVGCPVDDACHIAVCSEGMPHCSQPTGNDGQPCEDGDACTSGETCFAGTCQGAQPTDCSQLNGECSIGTCLAGTGCVPQAINDNVPCDQGNPCADSICKVGKCLVNNPKNIGLACDDGLFCTLGEACGDQGYCVGGAPTCVKPAACIDVLCNEAAQSCDIKPILNGEACEDGNVCTGGEICNNNVCSGGTMGQVYFTEDFSNNALGWTLGTEWQIAPAAVSSGGAFGADPAVDHGSTETNGVAGVVIGGNEEPTVHAPYYIESPPVDVSAATGKVFLTFYRWLNSDYVPYMRNMVEAFDGTAWVEVWTSGPPPGVQDSPPTGQGWTFQSFDITAYKNAGLRVRFGYEILQNGVYTIGSWNLDDVKLQNTPCPN
ncbi:MAG: hypothetical protein ABI193_05605 [Minicystis sp.]